MEDEILLKDIRQDYFENENITTWECVIIDHNARLYYKQRDIESQGGGFYFYAFEKTGEYVEGNEGEWKDDKCFGQCIVQGMAFFDGIRHLYYGQTETDNYGYHYYADLDMIIRTLQELEKLEDKFCDK